MDKIFTMKHLALLFLLIHQCVGPPAKNKESGDAAKVEEPNGPNIDDLGLEYNRYLKEVVNALESDPEFRKKLETADEADFRNGKVAAELEYVNHHVRTKLDELKRTELQRLRDLIHQAEEIEKNEVNPNHVNPGHIDHTNPHTFESADLHKLITQVRQDLAEADRKRREEFKEYELQKKFEQQEKIKAMDEEHRKQFLHELEEQKKKHQQHQPLHHPGSKAQLEEVWEKQDHMDHQKFNPRTFFLLHDINGDGYWDEEEVKALFIKELDKLYEAGAPEDDMREREEEMERMREHVFKESDTNGDRLISYEEFLEQTKKQEFNRDEGWDTIDSQPQFTQQEYEEFERRRQQEIQRLIEQGHLQPYPPGMMPPPGYEHHPGQFQQQYHYPDPNHPQQQYVPNAAYHPQAVPQPGQYPAQGSHQYPQQHYQPPVQQPNAVPQRPNQLPQQHLNQIPNQVPQQPNQVPQHHNQVPQAAQPLPNQASHSAPQPPSQVNSQNLNQVPQGSNQVPQHQYQQAPPARPQYQQGQPQQYQQAQAPQYQQAQQQQYQQVHQPQYQQGQPQQYHDPNQIVANTNKQAPAQSALNQNANQQIPSSNQAPQVKVGQLPSQGTYGSISNQSPPQPPSPQQNQINSDPNKVPANDPPK